MNFDIKDNDDEVESENDNGLGSKKLIIIIVAVSVAAIFIILFTYLILQSGNSTKNTQVPVQTTTIPTSTTSTERQKLTVFDEDSNERPIAVMIDNAIGDAKHAGLQESYLNYEIIVEGGLTRIMAIYKDKNVTLIGPIRSSRHYFLDYALESDAIYVHYGWSPYAEDDITRLSIDNVNGLTDNEAFRRDTKSIAPHNVFTRMSYLTTYLDKTTYNRQSESWLLFDYSAEPVELSDSGYEPRSAKELSITYSSDEVRTYSYDKTSEYYLRYSNGMPQLDRRTDKQLHYKNIIIQRVPNKTLDSEGRQEVTTTGTGKGYFITNGEYLPITWSKSTRESKTVYYYEDGTEITLNDGNTFVQIVPTESKITIE